MEKDFKRKPHCLHNLVAFTDWQGDFSWCREDTVPEVNEIRGLGNSSGRGREGEGGVLQRASYYGSEVLCIHFLSRYHRINKLLETKILHLFKGSFTFFSFSTLGRTCSLISPPWYKGGGKGWLDTREPLPMPLVSSLHCDILNSFYPK